MLKAVPYPFKLSGPLGYVSWSDSLVGVIWDFLALTNDSYILPGGVVIYLNIKSAQIIKSTLVLPAFRMLDSL